MKIKRKMGAGCGFKAAVTAGKKILKNNMREKNMVKLTKKCISAAKKIISKKTRRPRVIPIPKTGGMLPLIPIFAGLSALGSLAGGVAGVVKTVNEFNRTTPFHLGKGLYLAPYKGGSFKIQKGKGLYLTPYKGAGSKKKVKKTRKTSKN
jgi:hypothetical protein